MLEPILNKLLQAGFGTLLPDIHETHEATARQRLMAAN
jgi:hypothetical protein